ncbi:MAG TPA: hypothetical protein VNM14_25345 [Planctomycetota bacterium]|nr:hypothetical protein [Planctomycetota bacterium]
MPTHRHPSDKKEDRTRLRNLLDQAAERLSARGLRSPEVRKFLQPARDLLEFDVFWDTAREGLALFLSPSFFRAYTVSSPLREFVEVGERFYLKPLLPALRSDGSYYLLGLSQDRVVLLEGTRESLQEVAVPDLPKDLASALHMESFPPERQLEYRSQAPKAGRRMGLFHGHSEEAEDISRFLLDYFHEVDRAVSAFLRGRRAPLIVAAVEYLHPLYAEANTYPHLLRRGVTGNPDVFKIDDLHHRSWAVVESTFNQDLDRALSDYGDQAGGPRSSEEVSTVLIGAFFGRIGRLFVAADLELWGRFDEDSLAVRIHDTREEGDVDLLDWAAIRTLSTDGATYVLPRQRVPGGGPMAALFRF